MATNRIDPELLLPLLQALRLLPNVRPKVACDHLGEAKFRAARCSEAAAWIGTVKVGLEELGELFIVDARGAPRASPVGAALLLRLYHARAFDLHDNRLGVGATVALERYAASLPELINCQAQRDSAQRKFAEMLEHPERAAGQPFTFALLAAIFAKHRKVGPARLVIGETEVTKHCVLQVRGRKERLTRFTWIDRDGTARELTRPGAPALSSVSMLRARALARLRSSDAA